MDKLSIVFITSHEDTVGNANKLTMLKYIAQYFHTTVFTNKLSFVKDQFPNCQVYEFVVRNKTKIPIISELLYWRTNAKQINTVNSDAVFMVYDASPLAIWLIPKVYQYIDQYGNRSNAKSKGIKKKLSALLGRYSTNLRFKGLRKTDLSFAVSTPIVNLLKTKGVKNIALLPHAIDIKKYRNPQLQEEHEILNKVKLLGRFIVTYTGWVSDNRGFQLMLDGIKLAVEKDKQITLVIAGADTIFSEKIDMFINQNKLQDNIINFGVVDVSLIPGIIHYSDVCVSFLDDVPAHRVSPPQKIIEYFASSKPVICNNIETHNWLVEDGKTGLIIKYNAEEFTNSIIKLKNDNLLLKTMCMNAFKEVGNYDINIIYGKMVKKIKESINEN